MRKSHIPVIFLSCANSYQAGDRLPYLERERRAIYHILKNKLGRGDCEIVQDSYDSQAFFFDQIQHRKYHNRIAIIHFSGHGDGLSFRLESAWGAEEEVDVNMLAEVLGSLPGLHLVFLNGCGSKPIVERLLKAGIPLVLTTETNMQDDQASLIAEGFYESIANGMSIDEAFAEARELAGYSYGFTRVHYDDINGTLDWEEVEPGNSSDFPWGMYMLEGAEPHLNWRLDKPDPTAQSWLSVNRKNPAALIVIATLALLLLGISGFAIASFYRQKQSGQEQKVAKNRIHPENVAEVTPLSDLPEVSEADTAQVEPEKTGQEIPTAQERTAMLRDSSAFLTEGTYRVLLLPLKVQARCEKTQPQQYEKALLRHLNGISGFHGLRTEIRYVSTDPTPTDANDAEYIGQARHADFVIWGEYHNTCKDSSLVRLHYAPVKSGFETGNRFESAGTAPVSKFRSFNRAAQEQASRPIINSLFWVNGRQQIERKNYERALAFFRQIRVPETAVTAPVLVQQGICYLNLSNRLLALQKFERALELDRGYAPAYCYRGNVQRDRGRFDESWVDYSQAILHRPEYAEAYYNRGLLHEKFNKFEEAINDYEDAFRIQPDLVAARERSNVVRQTYNLLKDLNLQIASNAGNADLYFEKAKLLQYQLDNFDSALVYYNKGLELKPNYAHGYFERGHLYQYHLREYSKAIADYEQGLAIKPNYRFALGDLSIIYAVLRNDEMFYRYIARAMQNGYDINFFLGKAISEPYRDQPRLKALIEQYK